MTHYEEGAGQGARLAWIRRKIGLTQREMAESIGVGQSQYSKAEVGLRHLGRSPMMMMGERFGVNLEWLENGQGVPFEGGEDSDRVQETSCDPAPAKPAPKQWVGLAIGELDRDREFLERAAAELGVPIAQLMAAIGKRIQDGKVKGAES